MGDPNIAALMRGYDQGEAERRAGLQIIDHEPRGERPNGLLQQPKSPLDIASLCLSPAEWAAREIAPEDTLLGPFSTSTRAELSADTGLGKTMFGLALAHANALGSNFLGWKAVRSGRVLFLDGEMPPGLIKARLKVARSWFGSDEPIGRDKLCVLSRADIEGMPPLDTPEGARWLLALLEQLGHVDHITFDNRACLTVGDLSGDDASTQALKTLQREITKQNIGQLWLHHTGHDGSRGYGRKSREWELDTVMVGERLEKADTDVAFTLKFPKCRRRTPDNRSDYENIEVMLTHGQWSSAEPGGANGKRGKGGNALSDCARICLGALHKALTELGKPPPSSSSTIGVHNAVTVDQWRDIYARMAPYGDDQAEARKKAFQRGTERLIADGLVIKWCGWVWLP